MKKFENFKSALLNLKDIYSCQEPYSNVEIAGMVGLYEICFEQAWKAMKEILQNSGYAEGATGSPRTRRHIKPECLMMKSFGWLR
mgnify:CR=1 FL=1